MRQQADLWKPSLISGGIFGFLSGLPLVGLLNCACCSLVIGGGIVCSYMVIRSSLQPVSWGRSALAGFMSGVFAAPSWMLAQWLWVRAQGVSYEERFIEAMDRASGMSPEAAEVADVLSGVPGILLVIFTTLVLLVVVPPVATLGGVIGRALFEKRSTPPDSNLDISPS